MEFLVSPEKKVAITLASILIKKGVKVELEKPPTTALPFQQAIRPDILIDTPEGPIIAEIKTIPQYNPQLLIGAVSVLKEALMAMAIKTSAATSILKAVAPKEPKAILIAVGEGDIKDLSKYAEEKGIKVLQVRPDEISSINEESDVIRSLLGD